MDNLTRRVGPPRCQWHAIDQNTSQCHEPQIVESHVLICKKHLRYLARQAGYVPPNKLVEMADKMAEAQIAKKDALIATLGKRLQEERTPRKVKQRPTDTEGQVYFLQSDNAVKIGWTSDLEQRMKSYSPGAKILAVMPGTRKDETRLHRKFAHLRTNRREWFAYSPQVMEEVQRIVKEHGDPPRDLNEPMTTAKIVGPRLGGPMRIKDYRG